MATMVTGNLPGLSTVPTLPASTPSEIETLLPTTQSSEPSSSSTSSSSSSSVPTSETQTENSSSSSHSTSTSSSPTTSSEPTTSTSSTPASTSTSTESTESTETSTEISTSTSELATTVTFTSTASPTITSDSSSSSSDTSSVTSSTAASLPGSELDAGGSGGLSAKGTIAVAVVVPVVSVALIIIALLFWWRKRKGNKVAEEKRKQEIEEYRFNPNNDPTLPSVGAAGHYDNETGMKDSNVGYRGWGTTSTSRHATTNPSSGGAGRMTISDSGSNPGHTREVSSVDEGMHFPDDEYRQGLGNAGTIGDLPTAMAASSNNRADVHRGPSNASSAYSAANHSDLSDDMMSPGANQGAQYYDQSAYYNDGGMQHGSYGNNQPVIRDVQARRNTRIENPSVFPQQGNAGISQNF